jgi:hypothetical protein
MAKVLAMAPDLFVDQRSGADCLLGWVGAT